MATETVAKPRTSMRVGVQKFGTFLSGMIMPNIGVIIGAGIPMFIGAMIMGPLGGWTMKKIDSIWDGKIRPGFEMLVNNFSAGIWGMILAIFGFFVMSPIV